MVFGNDFELIYGGSSLVSVECCAFVGGVSGSLL